MKMRQNARQLSWIWYFLAFIGGGFLILKFIHTNSSNFDENECVGCSSKEKDKTERHSYEYFVDGNVVAVPISQIMAGKPIVLSQDDKRIIDYIWSNKHIHPPSEDEYNLKDPNNDPSRGQAQFIRRILKDMRNGFFVECGALDGETRSNTLFMEMKLGWKGLLIEGDPSNFDLMKKKNRKAWMANTCLAVKPYPHTATFFQSFNVGKVLDIEEGESKTHSKTVVVQCMPLFSLLSALNVTTVDYFSLDVEGSELKVLKTIPFDKILIKTLSVEYIHTAEGKEDIIKYMKSHGYKMVGEVHYPNDLANDLMFVHEDVKIIE